MAKKTAQLAGECSIVLIWVFGKCMRTGHNFLLYAGSGPPTQYINSKYTTMGRGLNGKTVSRAKAIN